MNEDRFAGTAKNLGGQMESGFGRVTEDAKTQAQGAAKQVEGTIQDLYGQAKDVAADAAQAVRDTAGTADDLVRTTIEQRPYTAAAIALGVGFLIGRFSHRQNY